MDIKGNKVLLVGNRGHKNMGDEIILVGNMKYLINQGKKVYIACSDKKWLKNFHKQFFIGENFFGNNSLQENKQGFLNPESGEQIITYVYELPKGFRSSIRLIKNIKDLKKMFEVNSILVGGGEILTEETPYSYFYWFLSTWLLLPFKNLYLSGGIQIPKNFLNKLVFNILVGKAEKLYVRDYELLEKDGKFKNKVEFFPDSSIFTVLGNKKYKIDLKKYKWIYKKPKKEKYIVVNVNKKAKQFLKDIEKTIEKYHNKNYEIYFAYICKSPADDDLIYYKKLKDKFPNIKLLDWEDFDYFLDFLEKAEKVYSTRLHLFLVSYYLDLDIKPFVYQKKVEKMKKVLST